MNLPDLSHVRIEWDAIKNRRNQVKHGIAFEEAAHVFRDPLVVMVQDRIEDGEARWQSIGMVAGVLLLLVAHTIDDEMGAEGEAVEVFRILSARPATKAERMRYESEDR
ncbi:MAG TPA: BrnT family toxin [Granulicella sp.]|jgi:hypothetical protein|nr:BrnT family toxin [Granulicella sp.]